MASYNWPSKGGGGIPKYPNLSSFPVSASDSDLAIALDTGIIYEYFGGNWVPVASAGSPLTVSDSNSIDLAITGNDLTAALKLSSASATSPNLKINLSIEADGLLAQISQASGSVSGYLSSTDWTTFNNKQDAGNYITDLTGDVTATGPGSAAATISAGAIDNAKVSASAAIDFSKLATLASGNLLVGSNTGVATSVAVTGDVTISNTGVTTIGANKVANSQLAQMPTQTIKGNNTGGTANAADLTASSVTAMLDPFVGDSGSGGTKGLVPAPASGDSTAKKYLNADGSWKAIDTKNVQNYVGNVSQASDEAAGYIVTIPTDVLNGSTWNYVVGLHSIEVFLNGVPQTITLDYQEVGLSGSTSNQIEFLTDLYIGDSITFKIRG